jgi:hypothetical protein
MTFPPAARRCRFLAILCTFLTFWTGIDSQVLFYASSGRPLSASPNPVPSQEDDDDYYVLDLTGMHAPGRGLSRNARPPTPGLHLPLADTKPCFSLSCQLLQLPPTMAVGEQEFRNGIGAPLLC